MKLNMGLHERYIGILSLWAEWNGSMVKYSPCNHQDHIWAPVHVLPVLFLTQPLLCPEKAVFIGRMIIQWWRQKWDLSNDGVIFSFLGAATHCMYSDRAYHIWTRKEWTLPFLLEKWDPSHSSYTWCCFLSFQRLVEAAEEAHLKHEFDADLQVTDYSWSWSGLCCFLLKEKY